MRRFLMVILVLIFINCCFNSRAQVTPADRSVLNYRLIGFSVPEQEGVSEYEFVVSELQITDTGVTIEKPVWKKRIRKNQLIETVPHFGQTYTWKVNYYSNGNLTKSSDLHRFATNYSVYIDTSKYRLRVETNNINNDNPYLFVDETRTLYDKNGSPLWYLPDMPGIQDEQSIVRDLKLSPFGTITFLTQNNIYEISYDGNILWQGPNDGRISGDSTEHYHHEFTRLKSGNYMVAASKKSLRELPGYVNKASFKGETLTKKGNKYYREISFGTIIEYDTGGNIVWSWFSGNYFSDADLFTSRPNGTLHTQTHFNSFNFNEDQRTIYVSFRNISRIIKIEYPSGKIKATYGESYTKDKAIRGHGLFYGQHTPRLSRDGKLYLFNNNNSFGAGLKNEDSPAISERSSSIVFLSEPVNPGDSLVKIWEYQCTQNDFDVPFAAAGGSATELNNGNLLVSMGNVNCHFMVTPEKEIIWKAISEKFTKDKGWVTFGYGYRNSPIESEVSLANLIFNIENGDKKKGR